MTAPLVPRSEAAAPLSRRLVLGLLGASILVFIVLWDSTVLLPVRWFVTLVHELGHALVIELVGGDTVDLTINSAGGGLTRSRMPDSTVRSLLVSSAGYVGSALFGAALLAFSSRARSAQAVFLGMAGAIVTAAVLWVPWSVSVGNTPLANASGAGDGDGRFTWVFALAVASVLIGIGFLLPVRFRQAFAVVLAGFCCVSALEDLRQLIGISTEGTSHSDATVAEAVSGLDAWFWAWVWAAMAALAILVGLRAVAKQE